MTSANSSRNWRMHLTKIIALDTQQTKIFSKNMDTASEFIGFFRGLIINHKVEGILLREPKEVSKCCFMCQCLSPQNINGEYADSVRNDFKKIISVIL